MAKSDPYPRILIFGGDGGRSGIPRHLSQLSETFAGHAHLTVVSDIDRGGFASVRRAGAVHHELAGLRNRAGPSTIWRVWRGMRQLVERTHWDAIWLHERRPALLLRLALALRLWHPRAPTRIILTYHNTPGNPGQRRALSWLIVRLERWLLARCPTMHLVVLTPEAAARLKSTLGATPLARHHVHVLPNSSNLGSAAQPKPQAGDARHHRHIVITGRTGYQKNYPLAARLMCFLPDSYVLTLCGPGTQCRRFQASLLRRIPASIHRRIRFCGPLCDVTPVLRDADCYLLTSRYEGLPIGAIEAFEAGLPLALSSFDAAPGLVAAHPLATCLRFRDMAGDADRIVALTEEFRRDRAGHRARIHDAWRHTFAYDKWQVRVRDLIGDILTGSVDHV